MLRILRDRFGLLPWIFGIWASFALGWALIDRPAAFSQTSEGAEVAPIVMELFTSQSCSSCPPADALLSELGSSTKGVIPLAYHVDYWNHLGWSDSFSSRMFSQRQSDYARAMNLDGDYTPQMVIGGAMQCVGSDRGSIAQAIAAARRASNLGRISLHAIPSSSGPHKLQVRVIAQISDAPGTPPPVVMLAIFENGLVTRIGGGENGGRQITYDYTVRKLLPAFQLDAAPGTSVEKELSMDLDPSWSLDRLGIAAFIQDPVSLKIDAAASEYPIAIN
jgi:hypothetical protein